MKRLLLFTIFCTLTFSAFAQSAEEIEGLLATTAVTYGEAAWLVLKVAETPGMNGPQEAFGHAREQKWLPSGTNPNATARLDGLSLLVMHSFGFDGGLLFKLTKNARYAYRELVHQGIIQGRTDPGMDVSGDLLLYIMSRVLSHTGG